MKLLLILIMGSLALPPMTFGEPPSGEVKLRIGLDLIDPSQSRGKLLMKSGQELEFAVGYGKEGVLEEGARFRGGYSLLGRFRVNAILSADRFEMIEELVVESGRSEAYLRENLFRNMSSIDFDGDGKAGEYGAVYIGLEPLSETKQPFTFQTYKGTFRWYSYAIHGTQDERRVGQRITGGCINLSAESVKQMLLEIELGNLVEISVRKAE